MKRLYTLLTIISLFLTSILADSWRELTQQFMQNSDFNNGNSDGWTINSNAGQQAVSANVMRFWNGTFDFYQEISSLPKGTYRLSVQGFYRSSGDSYQAFKNGTEHLTAFLYAGEAKAPLMSVYSYSMTSTVGNRQEHEGHYYPDNSSSAAAAFNEGLYQGNYVEFEAEGSVIIGIRCQEGETNNYCVFDNFKLEYSTGGGSKSWIDVTNRYLQNTGFDNGYNGWTWQSNAGSQKADWGSFEFWNGRFDFYQTVNNLPQGHYRLSVQAYYRCKDNPGKVYWINENEQLYVPGGYENYVDGSENITGYMYAGETSQQLKSVYSEYYGSYVVDGLWGAGDSQGVKYFPNTMQSARYFFDDGKYWNVMEFDGGGTINIGMRCQEYESSNWCIFDNFKLECYTDMVPITGISISVPKNELIVGETIKATANIEPVYATLPFVNWILNSNDVVTIDNNGNITAVGPGRATIWVYAADGSGVSTPFNITVTSNPATQGSFVINEIMPSNIDEYISPAFNFDGWVELYNPTDRPVELAGVKVSNPADPTSVWTMPKTAGVIPAKGFKNVWFDSNDGNPNNAPFKLDVDGGTITFSTANGKTIDSKEYPVALERISYARSTDGGSNWGYCDAPTPESTNNGTTLFTEQNGAPVVDQPSQLFDGTLTINVTIPSGCTLRYTDDGSLPTLTNGRTSTDGKFTIGDSWNFRFRLFGGGKLPSRVTTRSYIYKNKEYYLPVVSVVTDNAFINSSEIGVFSKGPNGRPGNGENDNCNWNMNWERPVNFSYITADGKMALNQDVDLEMCGGWSRAWWPHAFKLKGNKEMGGNKNLQFPFFEQKPYIRNRTLQIRNGGNDTKCRFRDPALQYIVESSGIDIDCQSYQPVHEFINYQYIGVMNIREPNNKHYVYANYGWDDDEIDQFEMSPDSGYVQKCGTREAFDNLVALSANASNSDTYAQICKLLDIDAYINYMATEMYLGNWDWPQNNVKGFRHRDGGRFRFVLFDLDGSFNTNDPFNLFFNKEYYNFDDLRPTGQGLGHISDYIRFVTLFGNLLANDNFRRRFIDAYCIAGGSVFEKNRASEIIDNLLERVEPAMNLTWESASNTANQVKNNLNYRLGNAIWAIKNYSRFELSNKNPLELKLYSNTDGVRLFINDQEIPTSRFDGQVFPPAKLRVEVPSGYVFEGWSSADGHIFSSSYTWTLSTGTTEVIAKCRTMTAKEKQANNYIPVRINEISGANDSYINEYFKKDDWVELYNTTSDPIDVEGMYLSDTANNPTKYKITKGNTTANTIIPAHGHLLVWCDKRETTNDGLHASFKISDDGGLLILTAADNSWQDVMNYGAHDSRTTIGRYPDGTNNVYAMNQATIAKTNRYSSYLAVVEQTGIPVVDNIDKTVINNTRLSIAYGSGQLIVLGDTDSEANISIYGSNGMLVQQTTVNIVGGSARLDVSDLKQGFYIAKVSTGDGAKSTCRFVK